MTIPRLERQAERENSLKIVALGDVARGVGLRLLGTVPDQREIQIDDVGDLELDRADGVLREQSGFRRSKDALPVEVEFPPRRELLVEMHLKYAGEGGVL